MHRVGHSCSNLLANAIRHFGYRLGELIEYRGDYPAMLLRNHRTLVSGRTIVEACVLMDIPSIKPGPSR